MSTASFNGVATPSSLNTHTAGDYIWTEGEKSPNARLAANGGRPLLVNKVRLYLAGKNQDVSVTVQFGLTNTFSPAFTVKKASSKRDTGWHAIDSYFSDGDDTPHRLTIHSSADVWFGRGNGHGGTTYDSSGNSWSGGIAGEFQWQESPSAPRTLSARPNATSVYLDWAPPSDDGDSSITDYVVQYSTHSNFSSGVTQIITTSTTSSYTVTGLTGANRYYFRVAARNAVTNRANTWSVYSNTATSRPLTGGNGSDLDPGYSLPSAPSSVTATTAQNMLYVDWSVPSSGGTPILDYQVQRATDSGYTTNVATYTANINTSAYTLTGLTAGTLYYARVRARTAVGYSSWSSTVSATTPVRTYLDAIAGASISLDSLQIELRSNGAATPTITLGYIGLTADTTFTSIDTIPTGESNGLFGISGVVDSLALTADRSGNLYIVGRNGGTNSEVLIKQYLRTGTTSWTINGSASQALTDNGFPLTRFVAEYMYGSVDSIFVLARRAGPYIAGNLSYATINPARVVINANDSIFMSSGTDPSWMPAPPTVIAQGLKGRIDAAALSDTQVAIAANGFSVVNVLNGGVSGVSKSPDRTDWWADRLRVVTINSGLFAVLRATNGALNVYIITTRGLQTVTYPIGASYANGGWTDNWDVFFNSQSGILRIYYVPNGQANTVNYVNLAAPNWSMVELSGINLTNTVGTTMQKIRVPRGKVDERKVVISATNLSGSTQSLITYADTVGNVPPKVPALVLHPVFDSDYVSKFSWTFGDYNWADDQSAYQIQFVNTATNTTVFDSGKVTSSNLYHSLAAGVLDDELQYGWRVRVYDALGAVSQWSNYSYVYTSDSGTVTITSPAADYPALVVDYLDIAWGFTTTGSAVQGSRRIKVFDNTTNNLLFDSGQEWTTDNTYRVTTLLSGTTYRIEVTVYSTLNIPAAAASRLVTPTYSQPAAPVFTLSVFDEFILLNIENPDDGLKPPVGRNDVYRREVGALEPFVKIGSTNSDSPYFDFAVASNTTYEYYVRSVSQR